MSIRSNIFVLTATTLLFCACGSDKNQSAPAQDETVQSMSQLKVSTMGACPLISGRYKCIENCEVEGKSMEDDIGEISLTQRGQGLNYHYSSGQSDKPKSFLEYLLDKYMLDDGGMIVDGQIHDKTAPIKSALEAVNHQLDGVTGHVLRRTLSLFGIDIDQEMVQLDIPNITAGYQASCNDNVLSLHYLVDKTAIKFKIKNLSENLVEVKAFSLEDQKLKSHTYKVELVESLVTDLDGKNQTSNSLISNWIENNPFSIRFENSEVYSYWNGAYLNMTFFRTLGEEKEKNIYKADYQSYWGDGDVHAYGIEESYNLYVDLLKLKVFTLTGRGEEKEVGSIYEMNGRAYIRLALDCGGFIFKTCKIE